MLPGATHRLEAGEIIKIGRIKYKITEVVFSPVWGPVSESEIGEALGVISADATRV
jgi:hypothetical protein